MGGALNRANDTVQRKDRKQTEREKKREGSIPVEDRPGVKEDGPGKEGAQNTHGRRRSKEKASKRGSTFAKKAPPIVNRANRDRSDEANNT